MEMACEIAHNIFNVTSIFSLVSARRSDVFASSSLFMIRDALKGKAKTIHLKCTNLHKQIGMLQEEVKVSIPLQEVVKEHGFPYFSVARVVELKDSLQDAEKCHKAAFDSVEGKFIQMKEQ